MIKGIVKNILSYSWSLNRERKSSAYYESILPSFDYKPGGGIPKKIHQVYLQGWEGLQVEIYDSIERIRELHPNWEYIQWDEQKCRAYIYERYGAKILEYYDRISPDYPNVKVDFFKVLVIYSEGGLYLDHKSSLTKSIDKYYDGHDDFIVGYWDKPAGVVEAPKRPTPDTPCGLIFMWWIFGIQGYPILREMILHVLRAIDEYNPIEIGVGGEGSFNIAGPTAYTNVILNSKYEPTYAYILEDWGGGMYRIP